jgi:hypothetical protein
VVFGELTDLASSIASSTSSAQLKDVADVASVDIVAHLVEKGLRRLWIVLGSSLRKVQEKLFVSYHTALLRYSRGPGSRNKSCVRGERLLSSSALEDARRSSLLEQMNRT